jgi:hypothetical protein
MSADQSVRGGFGEDLRLRARGAIGAEFMGSAMGDYAR